LDPKSDQKERLQKKIQELKEKKWSIFNDQ
jgi:hypothetical protein